MPDFTTQLQVFGSMIPIVCAVPRKHVLAELVVLVRDFELRSTVPSSEYLETMLANEDRVAHDEALELDDSDAEEAAASGNVDEAEEEGKKMAVKECFPVRHCYTLPHPQRGLVGDPSLESLGTASAVVSTKFKREMSAVVQVCDSL